MKKLLVLFLVLVMLVSVFACTQSDEGEDKNKPNTDKPADNTDKVDNTKPNLPDMTFNGISYRVSTRNGYTSIEVFADETATDIRQQALLTRNSIVEDKYGVVIEPVECSDNSLNGHVHMIMDEIFAEEDNFDIALTYAAPTGSLVAGGYVINWLNLPYNDFSKQYWINDVNRNLMLDGAIYSVVGDMCISTLMDTYGMFYNRTKGDAMYIDDEQTTTITEAVYDAIKNNEWTFDYFNSLVANIYDDTDETPGRSEDDFYGFTAEALTNLDIWQFAFDIPMIAHDDEEGLRSVFNTEKTSQMVDMLNTLYWENSGSNILNACTSKFKAGNALFHTTWLERCFTYFKDMEDHYSILPYPMFDGDQEKYMSGAMDNYNCITIPFTCTERDMVSYITEVLNYESRERLYPVYYEESLQKQYTRDPESIEMLDIIMDGRNFDLGTIFTNNINGISMLVRSAVANKTNDFAQYYNERSTAIDLAIQDLVEQYELNKRT